MLVRETILNDFSLLARIHYFFFFNHTFEKSIGDCRTLGQFNRIWAHSQWKHMSQWKKNHGGATILLSEPPCPSCGPGFEGWGKGRQIPLNVTWPLINEDSGEAPLTCLPRLQGSVCFDCIFIAGCAQPVRRQWAALLSCDFWPRPVCEGPGLCLSGRSAASPWGRMHNSPSNQTPTHSFQRSYH